MCTSLGMVEPCVRWTVHAKAGTSGNCVRVTCFCPTVIVTVSRRTRIGLPRSPLLPTASSVSSAGVPSCKQALISVTTASVPLQKSGCSVTCRRRGRRCRPGVYAGARHSLVCVRVHYAGVGTLLIVTMTCMPTWSGKRRMKLERLLSMRVRSSSSQIGRPLSVSVASA